MDASQPETIPQNCERHGPYEARVLFRHHDRNHLTRCPACELEFERLAAERRAESERKEHEERKAAALAYNLQHSGRVGRFKDATFENFTAVTKDQRRIVTDCRSFAETFDPRAGGGLWLIGPPGAGKTHLGSAMVSHVIRSRGMGAAIHAVHEIMALLRSRWGVREDRRAWDDSPATTDQFIDHLGSIPLLVLDDIGATRITENEHAQLYAIVDQRYRLERPTVVLSNLNAVEMKPVLGDRIYDRLREGSRLLVCKWESHRGTPRSNPAQTEKESQ